MAAVVAVGLAKSGRFEGAHVQSCVLSQEVGSLGQDAQRSRQELEDCTSAPRVRQARGPCLLVSLS